MKKAKLQLSRKAKKYLAAKELGKRSYETADSLLSEIAKAAKPGDVITVGDRQYELVDRFADGDLIWAHAAARRYELKEVKGASKLSQ